jgi:hypothetical protein
MPRAMSAVESPLATKATTLTSVGGSTAHPGGRARPAAGPGQLAALPLMTKYSTNQSIRALCPQRGEVREAARKRADAPLWRIGSRAC